MGEVQKVASDARQALEAGIRIASKVADCGPLGIKTSLTSAHLAIDQNEEEALSKLDGQFGALFHTQEFLEGRKAEAEGRKPVYRRNDRKSKQHATDSVSSKDKTMKLFTTVLLAAAGAFAQSSDRLPVTDADKIADALRAGPEFVTRDATLLDWPSAPGGEYRLLRKGSNEWACLPGIPGYPHDEPGCFDRVFLQWIQDSLAGHTPRIDRVGISYMYAGAWVKSAKSSSGPEFHVGSHLMIVSPHQDDFQEFNRDGSNGMPYVAHLPGRTELYLVMPIRQWDEQ